MFWILYFALVFAAAWFFGAELANRQSDREEGN